MDSELKRAPNSFAAAILVGIQWHSEEYYCAHWATGIEYDLWTNPEKFGAEWMIEVALYGGVWWTFEHPGGPRPVPLAEWEKMVAEKERNR